MFTQAIEILSQFQFQPYLFIQIERCGCSYIDMKRNHTLGLAWPRKCWSHFFSSVQTGFVFRIAALSIELYCREGGSADWSTSPRTPRVSGQTWWLAQGSIWNSYLQRPPHAAAVIGWPGRGRVISHRHSRLHNCHFRFELGCWMQLVAKKIFHKFSRSVDFCISHKHDWLNKFGQLLLST